MAFSDPFRASEKSLTRPARFAGPYVTSVGGTTNFHPESAANLSGGGFSFYFSTPEYQHGHVESYILQFQPLYNNLYKCALFQLTAVIRPIVTL